MTKRAQEKLMKMNLQYFAEPEENGEQGSDNQGGEQGNNGEENKNEKMISRAEMVSIVTQQLEKQKSDLEASYAEKIQQAKKDAEEKAKMTEQERADAEKKEAEQALQSRLADLERRELLADAKDMLTENNLPINFSEMVLGKDKETTEQNILSFKEVFETVVEDRVKDKLKGKRSVQNSDSSVGAGNTENNPFTKEHWNITTQAKLFKTDKALYEKLKNEANTNI